MPTKEEVTEAAQAARDAVEAYYDQALDAVEAEASFWKDSVTSPLAAISVSAVDTALADAASTLEELGVDLG